MKTATNRPTEGWGLLRPGDSRAHYYRNGEALCGSVAFYRGYLEPGGAGIPESSIDCDECGARLGRWRR